MRIIKYLSFCISLMVLSVAASCSDEEEFSNDASVALEFSDDTIHFDTIFTSIGSATKRFKIYNKGKQGVRIPSIRLGSGGSSGFRVNLDGRANTQFSDVEIYHGDSLFCFVEVTVNPHDSDSPILLSDSLIFTLPNGKTQQVILQAYGQDIIILKDRHVETDTSFEAKRPYVIYDSLTVDSGATLTLKAGTVLCFHSGASLNIHGKVIAEGEVGNPVTMRCDRTDKLFPYLPYDRTDAQWGGITIYQESEGNRFIQCDIHGGSYGIRNIGSKGNRREVLYMLNSIIHNVAGDALNLTDIKSTIHGCQITNAQGNCVTVTGGDVEFSHCTIAQFYPWSATYGNALYFTNHIENTEHPLINLSFVNSIITGYSNDELFGVPMQDSDTPFNYHFAGCLINTVLTEDDMEDFEECRLDTISTENNSGTIDNSNKPKPREGNFRLLDTDNFIYDFRLDTLSAARQLGVGSLIPEGCRTDMNGKVRNAEHPDAGCYQFE